MFLPHDLPESALWMFIVLYASVLVYLMCLEVNLESKVRPSRLVISGWDIVVEMEIKGFGVFCWVRSEKDGLYLVSVEDEIVLCCPVARYGWSIVSAVL